jgi:hypothetical protein
MAELYENFLKGEYAVEGSPQSLVITPKSCYRVGEETLWLIARLPQEGDRETYLSAMKALGIAEPQGIFDRLAAIGVLRLRVKRHPLKRLAEWIFTPDIRLVPAGFQQRVVDFSGCNPAVAAQRFFYPAAVVALAGLLGGIHAVRHPAAGHINVLVLFVLVLLGSLLHELGHSFMAAAGGVGLRPIGFSVYLFYPVFYTNVSGMEKLPLAKKLAIDTGGFMAQCMYLAALLAVFLTTGNAAAGEAMRWISLIMCFNLNPLLRTDAYWFYSDLRERYRDNRWMRRLHTAYLAAFSAFTAYFLWRVYKGMGYIIALLATVWTHPAQLFSSGYRIILGCYFLLMAFLGGMRRLDESRREWQKRKN